MLTKEQIQGEIVMTVVEIIDCGARGAEMVALDAKIKAYLFVITGTHYKINHSTKTSDVYEWAEIKHTDNGDTITIDDDELDRMGLYSDEDFNTFRKPNSCKPAQNTPPPASTPQAHSSKTARNGW